MKTKLLLLLLLANFSIYAQYTSIPDVNFEKKLIALNIDSGVPDGQVLTSRVATLTTLDVSSNSISNLTGIQDFVRLIDLKCYSNNLVNLDLSKNTVLKTLNCDKNQLISLNLDKNVALTSVSCEENQIKSLDVSRSTSLTNLSCKQNEINSLDLSKNIALTIVNCAYNKLTLLNVSKNVNLTRLECERNQLTTLDLNSPNLTILSCAYNQITTLDVSQNSKLKEFSCNNNSLSYLNLHNKNNISLTYIDFTINPNLDCIVVDNLYYSYANWPTKKDDTANYVPFCGVKYALIPDANFEKKLVDLNLDDEVNGAILVTSEISSLKSLDVSGLKIKDLTGIEEFTSLTYLNCSHNQLTNLNVTKNTLLSNFKCEHNYLTSLDVSKNINLGQFLCNNNQLTALDVSKSKKLSNFYCSYNQLVILDVSKNPDMRNFDCTTNKLVSVNLKNGHNGQRGLFANADMRENPDLKCIQMDENPSDYELSFLADSGAKFSSNCPGFTIIPDSNFEDKLIALKIDTDGKNGLVATSSINTITELDIPFSGITDLTGIQDFSALTKLFCGSNQLKNIDVSKNTALKQLTCESNQLTKLDVSKNADLSYLKCDKNQLTTLDVKTNTALTYLSFSSNQLTTIDVSKNIALNNLICSSNLLSNLDVSQNTALVALYCDSNQLSTIDVSKNKILNYFYCDSNQLTNLNVSNNIDLSVLTCASNQLTALDISKNTALAVLLCNNNQLTSLNLKNGKNSISPSSFDSTNNPNLKCIQVNDVVYANTNWINKKDTIASFNVDCIDLYTKIPDINFEKKLISLGIDVGVPDGKVLTPNLSTITSLDVSLSNISDLTGIQDFSALKLLKCNDNLLKNLDVSKNTSLTNLFCFSNELISLDVSNNSALIYLSCYNNRLTDMDISKNPAVDGLSIENNQLTTLNLKNGNNTILHFLNATNNPNLSCIQVDSVEFANANWITSKDTKASYNLDCTPYTLIPDSNFEQKLINSGIDTDGLNGKVLTNNISTVKFLNLTKSNISDLTGIEDFASLTDLYCGQNSLTKLNVSKNTALTTLDCNNNKITSLDVSNNTALLNLSCYANQLTVLDVKVNTALTKLDSGSNQYTVLDVSSNTALTFLGCNTSQLTTLDISKNTALNLLDCRENKLTQLNVSKITTLTELYCQSNQLTNLDVSKNKVLEFLNCSKNQLTTLDVSVNTALVGLYSNSNQLTSLNLKNANNVKLAYLNLKDNPNLSCIQVDDSKYFDTNWADKKDKNASYNANCTSYVQIPDSNFEQKLIDLGIDTDGLNGKISIADASSITSLDVSNSTIKNLSGIENFTSLTYLDCSNNQLTNLDVTHNVLLETLNASSNQLTSLDLSKNSKLTIVYVVSNPLVFLNLQNGNNKNMIVLNVTGKKEGNNLTTTFLGLNKLSCVKVDDASFANANWSKIKESTTIYSSTCSLGLEDSVFDKVVVYPNPTKGEITINNITLEKATVYNTLGQLVKSFTLDSGNTTNTIDLSGLPRGVYYVYLINQDVASAKKVIVE